VAFRENEESCGFGKSLVDFLWRSQAPLIVHHEKKESFMLSFFRVAFRENEESCGFGKSLADFLWRSQAPLIVHHEKRKVLCFPFSVWRSGKTKKAVGSENRLENRLSIFIQKALTLYFRRSIIGARFSNGAGIEVQQNIKSYLSRFLGNAFVILL
jgi:hypothetical protein